MAKKKSGGAKKSCACPKGFDLRATDPLTGKKFKRSRCAKIVTRGRKASVKTKAPKCTVLKGSCPKGYSLGAHDPKTGRRFKRAMCVAKSIVATKRVIAAKRSRSKKARRR